MKTLSLIIKKKYLDEILSGEKKIETREIRPKNASRYCKFDNTGLLLGPVEYDALQLFAGYQTDRAEIIVRITGSEIILFDDEETGEPLTYEENGKLYIDAEIEYQLGDILSKINC